LRHIIEGMDDEAPGGFCEAMFIGTFGKAGVLDGDHLSTVVSGSGVLKCSPLERSMLLAPDLPEHITVLST